MSVIGIDFGTTFCSASWVNPKTGFPEAITFPYAVDTCKIPSIVFFPPQGEAVVGYAPYMQIENAATSSDREAIKRHVITSIKRKMRRGGSFQGHSHVEIISLILKHVIEEAQKACQFDSPIDKVVLTHPVVFDEWQKNMLIDAASLVGFSSDKVTLLEEPVSAALSYIKSNQLNDIKGVLVYDFGGGTFDVAYVQIDHHGKLLLPIDPQGDPVCGGNDIDILLYDQWDKMANQKYGRQLNSNPQEVDEPFLSRCRKQKELISVGGGQRQRFSEILPPINGHGFEHLVWDIREDEYNQIISPIIDRTMTKTQIVLDAIRGKKLPIDVVLLIGGSSRIPQVKQRLGELLGNVSLIKTPGLIDTAVAVGASYYAMGDTIGIGSSSQVCSCVYCDREICTTHRFCMYCGKENPLFK